MSKGMIAKFSLIFSGFFVLLSLTACEFFVPDYSDVEEMGNIRRLAILNDNSPTFGMIISDELMNKLETDAPDVLRFMKKYFSIVIDEEMESTLINIKAKDINSISRVSHSDVINNISSSDTPSANAEEITADSLKYKDYYIKVDYGQISVICGSEEAAIDALNYIKENYIENGEMDGDGFFIAEPESEVHSGEYLDSTIAGNHVEDYCLVYETNIDYGELGGNASYLNEYVTYNFGKELTVSSTDCPADSSKNTGKMIVLGKTEHPISQKYYSKKNDICSYRIVQSENDLYIMGGSEWGIKAGIDYIINEYFAKGKDIPGGCKIDGTFYGQCLFDKYEGSDLRIMTSNAWENKNNNIFWSSKGEDCSIYTRLNGIAKTFTAYDPDVLCLQEIEPDCINDVLNGINAAGRNYKMVGIDGESYGRETNKKKGLNHTPILYNADEVTLLDSNMHIFTYGSNSKTKSYTWGYFEKKDTGDKFVVFSTHLWWKKDNANRYSSRYRKNQLTEISNEIDKLIKKYDCPYFVLGDLNCTASSEEFQVISKLELLDCYDIATEFADDTSGRYYCTSTKFSNKVSNGKYNRSALDHVLAKNLNDCKVLAYDYVTPDFYGKLSDHAPLYVDVKLGSDNGDDLRLQSAGNKD